MWNNLTVHPILFCFLYSFLFVCSLYFVRTKLPRNHPITIRNRFVSVTVASLIIILHVSTLIRRYDYPWSTVYIYDWKQIFITLDNFWSIILYSTALTLAPYLGTLVDRMCSGQLYALFSGELWEYRLFSWVSVRNLIVAPAAEELIFRACILYHLLPLYTSCWSLCVVSPLFFSIAHFHHMLEHIHDGERVLHAFLKTLFQVAYTTIFGAYSAFLLLRTGSIFSAIVAHALCNLMSLPDFPGALKRGRMRWGVWGQLLAIIAHTSGLVLWAWFLFPATDPRRFGNTTARCVW
ncbi:unnamed protein product [Dicrocoelium dendriticum]|nr:unnamed protein product [Dicrocoelium dendriticum]